MDRFASKCDNQERYDNFSIWAFREKRIHRRVHHSSEGNRRERFVKYEGEMEVMMATSKTVSSEQSVLIQIEIENAQGRHVLRRERPWLRIASVVGAECFLPIENTVECSTNTDLAARYALFLFRQNDDYYLTVFPLNANGDSDSAQTTPIPILVDSQPILFELFRAYPVRSQFVWNGSRFTLLPCGESSQTVKRSSMFSAQLSDTPTVMALETQVSNVMNARTTESTMENLTPDVRGSAGTIQPVFSIRSGSKEIARRRLSRTLTWIGRSRFASLPILHPSVAPAHCVCWWNGETVELIDLFSGLGTFVGAVPHSVYRGVGTGVSSERDAKFHETRDETLQRFDVHAFRPGERLQFGDEIEIRFPGFTRLAEGVRLSPHLSREIDAKEKRIATPQETVSTFAVPSTISVGRETTAELTSSASLIGRSIPVEPIPVRQKISIEPTNVQEAFSSPEYSPSRSTNDEARGETNDCVRCRHEILRQREELERQSHMLERREEQLRQQEVQQRQMRTILMSQQSDLEKLRDELDLRQRRQEEVTRSQQRERLAFLEEKQQITHQREMLEQVQQRLSEERAEWVTWRRRYEAEMFRLAAEFAQRNVRDEPSNKRVSDATMADNMADKTADKMMANDSETKDDRSLYSAVASPLGTSIVGKPKPIPGTFEDFMAHSVHECFPQTDVSTCVGNPEILFAMETPTMKNPTPDTSPTSETSHSQTIATIFPPNDSTP